MYINALVWLTRSGNQSLQRRLLESLERHGPVGLNLIEKDIDLDVNLRSYFFTNGC